MLSSQKRKKVPSGIKKTLEIKSRNFLHPQVKNLMASKLWQSLAAICTKQHSFIRFVVRLS